VAALAVASTIGAEVWGLRTHTLHQDGQWESAKLALARPVMGAVGFVATPVALSGNVLDLGAWHGFQQIAWHRPVDAARIAFNFELGTGAHLSALYGGTAGGWAGLRLSRHPSLPSRHFLSANDGKMMQAEALEVAVGPGWHHVALDLGEVTRATLDGRPLPVTHGVAPGPRRVGFRGSAGPSRIDDVEITLRDGRVLRDDFRNRGGLQRALWIGFLVLAAIETLRRAARLVPPQADWVRLSLALTACVVAGLGWLAQTRSLGRLYPSEVPEGLYANRIETPSQAIARLGALEDPRPAVLVLGGSQAWGAGAGVEEEVWTARLEAALGGAFRVWNAGISGNDSRATVSLYRELWAPLKPRLVIGVFGVNDNDPAVLAASLTELVQVSEASGTDLVLVQEAVAPEAPRLPDFSANREVMATIAARHEVPLFDMHIALARRRDEGLLWWDFVHLSAHGQRLFSESLAPVVREALGPADDGSPSAL
jgi:lysophospholipase L1-like esterase